MIWLLMSAVAVASFFYGAYYRSQAKQWEAQNTYNLNRYVQAKADAEDRAARYEGVIAGLKGNIKQLEDLIYASNDPAAVRALFSSLFPPNPNP